MPRTKYARNKTKAASDSTKDYDILAQTFDRHVQLRIAKLERDAQADIKSFEAFADVTSSRLPTAISQMTLGEILDYKNHDDKQESYNDETGYKTAKRTTTATDDGYGTERGTSVDSTSRAAKRETQKLEVQTTMRRTRSSSRASRTQLSEITQKMATAKSRGKKMDIFKTPAPLNPLTNMYDVVTPKIKPNTPMNVLRRPRQGEMVLSMQGSPLLVSAVVEEKTANINVPLGDGNVMSLLPQAGLRMSHIPPLDLETMQQLETLKNHIEKVIASK
ncbi:borealin isoform X2 [Polyergus mexicanus]|uniref:borealin isoform X2 n=1 Tax=Polyergus mexicanus TaxID=615972 RepID=UPI0038B62551